MWYSQPSGWTYYESATPYTANYGTVPAAPVVPEPAYVAPAYAPAPAVEYYPGYNYSYGYPGYYYGRGIYIGGPRWGVRVGGRW
jgi:hypothetical protein